jgi:glycosyltransferase involved in cell wall biosynthesis
MHRFSLVIATLGRTIELQKLLDSIVHQGRTDLEVILVDQNEDDRIPVLLRELPASLSVKHLRLLEKNVSLARNFGMDAATGEIICFPDDDCWYPNGLLDSVDSWFVANRNYSVLAVGSLDEDGAVSGNRWFQDSCDITPFNSLRTTFCSSLFIADLPLSKTVRFDERLNRGEETDFILRLLAVGRKGRFDRKFHVHHPRRDMLSGTVSAERAESYGAGMGHLVRRHSLPLLWLGLIGYDLARFVLVSARGQFGDARFCLAHTRGLYRGFMLHKQHE